MDELHFSLLSSYYLVRRTRKEDFGHHMSKRDHHPVIYDDVKP